MSVLERVSLLNSYNTLLNDDSDFSRFEQRLTNFWSWVLFSDMSAKPEFNISGTSWTATITSWEAIITTTRATSSPITWKKTPIRYQLSDTKTLTNLVSWSKIYIEIDQTLVDNPTLIQDTYPSTDYANWLNIWTLTHATSRPATNTYIPLWELSWIDWTWTDLRSMPKIKGNRIDFVDVDWNISTEWNITAQDITALWYMNANEFITPTGSLQTQIDDINISMWTPQEFLDDSFMLWEPVLAWQCVFLETWTSFINATVEQSIWNVSDNTKISLPVIWSWVAWTNLELSLAKVDNAWADLLLRIENEDWDLIDANATSVIDRDNLTTNLTNYSISINTTQYTDDHWQTLNSVDSAIIPHNWIKFTLKKQVWLVSVVKNSSCTATKCYLYDSDYNLLETKTFSWDTATWGYWDLTDWETYYVLAWSDTSTYNSVKQSWATNFPYIWDSLDIEKWFSRRLATDNGWEGGWSDINTTASYWFLLKAKERINIDSVYKASYTQADRAIIRNSWWTILATAFFSWDTATFDKWTIIEKNEQFMIEVWKWWSTYMCRRTLTWTSSSLVNTERIQPSSNWIPYSTAAWCWVTWISTTALIEENNINNIESITTNENFLINKWHKAYIVLSQVGNVLDQTRYFKIWYSANNTTTRWMRLWDWATRTVNNDKFAYVNSYLFENKLLSLTNSDYSYKVDLYWISTENKNTWLCPRITISWINNKQTWLTDVYEYCLTSTPWGISRTAGTNKRIVWKAISDTKIKIYDRSIVAIAWTTFTAFANNKQVSTTSLTPVKIKASIIILSWTYTTSMDIWWWGGWYYAYLRIYRNGVAYWTQRSEAGWNSSWNICTEDLYFDSWDEISVYWYTNNAAKPAYVKDLNAKYTPSQLYYNTIGVNIL